MAGLSRLGQASDHRDDPLDRRRRDGFCRSAPPDVGRSDRLVQRLGRNQHGCCQCQRSESVVRTGSGFSHATDPQPPPAERSADDERGESLRLVALRRRHIDDLLRDQSHGGLGQLPDLVHLLLGLHPDEGLVVVEHRRRDIARCAAGDDRVDGRRWIHPVARGLGFDRHCDPLAVSSLHGNRLVVQGSILPGGLSDAHRRGAIGACCWLACRRTGRVALSIELGSSRS